MDNDGVVKKSWALLIFLRDLDVFFLGTAMVFLLFLVIHVFVPPLYFLVILKSFSALNVRLTESLPHEQLEVFKSMPHSWHNPLHASLQRGFNGISIATCSSIS